MTVIDSALKLTPYAAQTPTFTDVNTGEWFYQSVETAVYAGIIVGSGGSTFNPNAPITRQDICILLEKGLGKTVQALADSTAKTAFTDDASINWWARGFVAQASNDGLIKGYSDGSFKPENDASRAEACAMISNLLALQAK